MNSRNKILVTGSSGFVGSALIRALSENIGNVFLVAPVRSGSASYSMNQLIFSPFISSIDDGVDWSAFLEGVDTVIHCAGRVHVMDETEIDPCAAFCKTNVDGTLHLANQAAQSGVRRFIFLSTIKVNGERTLLGSKFTADEPVYPVDPYAVSKFKAELGLKRISGQSRMEYVVIRPPLVYGPGVKANFESMLNWVKRGIPLPFGGLKNNCRSLVYVDNLVDLICTCIDHPKAANQVFLVSDDQDVSTKSLLQKISHAYGLPSRLINIPPALIKLCSKLVGRSEIADRLCGSLQVDITKTKQLLCWKPKFSLDEGLLATAKSSVTSCDI